MIGIRAFKVYTLFSQKSVDNFEIEYKICLFLVRGAVPPLKKKENITTSSVIGSVLSKMENVCNILTWCIYVVLEERLV